MPSNADRGWFDEPESAEPALPADAPLAERMRPATLDEFVGQEALIGPGRWLRRVVESDAPLPSLILWGPPGTGKTTLARILAKKSEAAFVMLSAVSSGVKDVRAALDEARDRKRRRGRTILFIDEIHRFNKAQQDALLGAVEDGTITLIGATTENPSFEVNGALLSRTRVLMLKSLSDRDLETVLRRALVDKERGLGASPSQLSESGLARLIRASGGDARVALTAIEVAAQATEPDASGVRQIEEATLIEALGRARFSYDKAGEDHYNLASALIKSIRNSDENAAIYWLSRLIEGGADPMFIARRLCILASEDIGLADPQAIVQASAAAQITHLIGLPEGLYPLSQATLYLARAPKSNLIKTSYHAAADDAADTAAEPVPLHLRNAVTPLMGAQGYGKGYRYAHDDPAASREMPCLPERLIGRIYVRETGQTDEPS